MYDALLHIREDNADIMSLQQPVDELTKEYQEYKINNSNLFLTAVTTAILVVYFVVGVVATYDPSNAPSTNPFTTASVSFTIACLALLALTLAHRVFTLTHTHPALGPLTRALTSINQSPLILRLLNDALPVLLALRTGFTLLSRVGPDACEALADPSHLYDCVEAGGRLPPETYAFCLYVVLLPQMFIKGASRAARCMSW
jgi:uncharacterized membrane protein (DUF485 family)